MSLAKNSHTEILKVEGMTCGHCQAAVEKALKQLNGVKDVAVSLEKKEVEVAFDNTVVTVEALKKVIEEEGYQVI